MSVKVIIAGGRDFEYLSEVMFAMNDLFGDIPRGIEVVSGGARGADALGEVWASKNGQKLKIFPADWDAYGKSAGYIRNHEMALYADMLVAFWDGESRGTHHMIEEALAEGLEVHVYRY